MFVLCWQSSHKCLWLFSSAHSMPPGAGLFSAVPCRIHQKYLNLCSEDERRSYRFRTTWGWVINDRIFIFGWTIPLRLITLKHLSWNLIIHLFINSPNHLVLGMLFCLLGFSGDLMMICDPDFCCGQPIRLKRLSSQSILSIRQCVNGNLI